MIEKLRRTDGGFTYEPTSAGCGLLEEWYLMICRENDSGNKKNDEEHFWTRQRIGSSSLESAAKPKQAMVIVIKSDQDHINKTGPLPDLRNKLFF